MAWAALQVKADLWKRVDMVGVANMRSHIRAGRVMKRTKERPKVKVSLKDALSSKVCCRERVGSMAVPKAMPKRPRGNWTSLLA